MTKKIYLFCVAFCLFACIFSGCGQAKKQTGNQAENSAENQAGNPANPSGTEEITQAPDWTAAFQPVDGGQATPAGTGKATQAPKPTKKPAGTGQKITYTEEEVLEKLEHPTQIPPREFAPMEEQTELVLWQPYYGKLLIDKHILPELNQILQDRGYSFYLAIKTEPEKGVLDKRLTPWQEVLDAGEQVDLIFMDDGADDFTSTYTYGEKAIVRAIRGGYLLPFSAYPETEAKKRLLAAYPESYWRLCSFQGENYGVSKSMCIFLYTDRYLLWNLDAAEKAGLLPPEEIDIMHLDGLLAQAAAAGIPGIYLGGYGLETDTERLSCDLYVKFRQDGSVCLTNPYSDEEIIAIWDTLHRYKENSWLCWRFEEEPLLMYYQTFIREEELEDWRLDLEKNSFIFTVDGEEKEIHVKIYPLRTSFLEEGNIGNLLGITTASKHPEEATELLSLLQSDEEIVQLLRYGIENVHYCITENGVENVKSSSYELYYEMVENPATGEAEPQITRYGFSNSGEMSPPRNASIGNILLPVELDGLFGTKDRREACCRSWEGMRLFPYLGDFSEEQKGLRENARDILYQKKSGSLGWVFFDWQSENYKKTRERMQGLLSEAGYDRLVEEMNQKLGLE